MKRKILASVFGLGAFALAASSYGQGQIAFQSYNFGATSLNAPVTFGVTQNSGGVNGVAGTRIGKSFTADLLFSLDGGANYTLLTQAASGDSAYPTPFAFGLGNDGDSVNYAGYFFGNTATIPGYTGVGSVSFIVEAFNGTSYNDLNTTTWRGQSAAFSMPIAYTGGGATPTPSDFVGLNAFTVNPVPEPSIFALAGLGAAGLMVLRRKK